MTMTMRDDIKKVLIDESVIGLRLDKLVKEIEADFAGREMLLVGILNGGCVFVGDLLKRFTLPLKLECILVSSYRGATTSSGEVSFRQDDMPDVAGRTVLLVDDILDTGRTLDAVSKCLRDCGAAEVKTCVFARKDIKRMIDVNADYVGFDIGDEFVVGYGLDYMGYYRNLPFVGELSEAAIVRLKKG